MTGASPFHPILPEQPGQQIVWSSLSGCADSLALASALTQNQSYLVVITADSQTALRLQHEIEFFVGKNIPVEYFPDWETLPYDVFSPLPEIVSQRLEILAELPQRTEGILILTVSTLMQRLTPRSHILGQSLAIHPGNILNIDNFREQLEQAGYQCVSQVIQHADFAIRGSIIDIFPIGGSVPYRIELFDDEVDSIRTFDTDSQRSIEKVDQIEVFPTHEFPFDDESIKTFRKAYRNAFQEQGHNSLIYQEVSKGNTPGGLEYYIPLFVEHCETLFDYFPDNSTLVINSHLSDATSRFWQEVNTRYEQRGFDLDRPPLPPDRLFLDSQQVSTQIDAFKRIEIQNPDTVSTNNKTAGKSKQIEYNCQPLPELSFNNESDQPALNLTTFLCEAIEKTLFVAETAGHREALHELLGHQHIHPATITSWQEFIDGDDKQAITIAPMDHGLWCLDPAIAIITETQLSGRKAAQRRRRKKNTGQALHNLIHNLNELEIGSPVVHQDQGIGRYQGLQKLTVGDIETEFLTLEYAKGDKLYVPVSSLHLISRYTGTDPDLAPLHKLGGEQWGKARAKAIKRVRDVAAELLDIHARRAARKGQRFNIDESEYQKFSAAFPFEETPDQETAIIQVVEDMAAEKPMDRIICGDVGFGKTEVAMRAAFIAASNARQVIILAPTTLLAHQHVQNFQDRFADWPIQIDVLSRFVSKKQQTETVAGLAQGKIDIVIGTHRLLQADIQFKDLGLVIIDEEHRFGVRQKESLKKLRAEVDFLTLTATPIPRTLNMAMSGLRDISIIASPPPNRHRIQTFINEWNDQIIQEACLREIRRGGQIYFVHNNIKTMERAANDLQKLVPEANIRIGHGQMSEHELEPIMLDFYHQRFNVLLCTTIIESGIDVPSANTMIINRADKFGLAQLHQLRGRVGRSHHRAYAYLVIPPKQMISKDAVKRLEAIEASGELGAGFMLSSHDMEIRGAGELLGDEQSGQIQEIGFSLYSELLERAVSALRSGKEINLESPLDSGPEVDLHCSALIPDDYLGDVQTRLVLYKRISNAESADELRELQIEMIDRFGLLPEATKILFRIAELKLLAARLGIQKIDASAQGGRLLLGTEPRINFEALIQLIQTQPDQFKLDGQDKLRFYQEFSSEDDKIQYIEDLLERLSQKM
ncbi:MAG TPA: transcription-repair coupling factor [Crenotrichaceae bacterium]|nr:transcription-repair coupling factor [Crenotrichaceae bacterium]